MKIDEVHAKATGRSVVIGMIDTGVDSAHPDLTGQIARNENFAAEISPSFTDDKHGTAVAGIMVAKKNNGTGIVGVAPDAKLVALKACWPDRPDSLASVCNSYTLALAVNTAVKAGVNVLNMSLTGPQDTLLEILLNKAIEKGIIVVAADTGPSEADENFPASMAQVIPVQAAGQARDEDSAEKRSVTAPGDKILTTLPHGTYDFISGSSMAAAEVSGIIALMLELKPDLGVDEIKSILQQSAAPEKLGIFSGINANDAVLAVCKLKNCMEEGLSFAWGNF
jgi:subtilisin family serine protease